MIKKNYMKRVLLTLLTITLFFSNTMCKNNDTIKFSPVQHASFVIEKGDLVIYVDPVGSMQQYSIFKSPDLIIYTHEHSDHFDELLFKKIKGEKTEIIAPSVITNKLGEGKLMNNGDKLSVMGIDIEAVPMYNISPEKLKYHKKGVGNGYILTIDKKRIFISGDTEDIPEILNIKNIDYAFVCMNLPYTMSLDQAVKTVLTIKPKIVYPYHYRGSNVNYEELFAKFKSMVSTDSQIEVQFLKWY